MKEVSKPITEVYERIVEASGRVLLGLTGLGFRVWRFGFLGNIEALILPILFLGGLLIMIRVSNTPQTLFQL